MKKYLLLILVSIYSITCLAATDANADAKELSARDGLPNFYKKAQGGGDVKIAYLGGSITEQTGWRVQSLKYFQQRFPKANFSEINAAIGGTGSNLGVFRLARDVLDKNPDLVFIEFSCNDGGLSEKTTLQSMEGIVRQIWKKSPEIDICIVYVMVEASYNEAIKDGKFTTKILQHERVANHYKIPSIAMFKEIAKLANEGKLIIKTDSEPMSQVAGSKLDEASAIPRTSDGKIPFAKDGVHPYPNTGHVLYEQALERSFAILEKYAAKKPHSLPAKLVENPIENAHFTLMTNPHIKFGGDAENISDDKNMERFKKRSETIFRLKPNATMQFKFKGTVAYAYDIVGTFSGTIEIKVDGKAISKNRRFDPYCTWNRAAQILAAENLKNEVHTVEIKVFDEQIDKRAIIFPNTVEKFDANKDAYAPTNFYPIAILTDGELVK